MANSFLWWYPQGATAPTAIDLGRKVSDLQLTPTRDRVDVVPAWGVPAASDLGGARGVRISLESMSGFATADLAIVRKLQALEMHLQRGGFVTFCLDQAKVWGQWTKRLPQAGDTTIVVLRSTAQFAAYNSSGTVAAGDNITIESPNPELLREYHLLSAFSGVTCTPTEPIYNTFQQGPVFVRYADFYPALWLPEGSTGQMLMQSDHRRTWTLDLPLVEYPGAIENLSSFSTALGTGAAMSSSFTLTMERLQQQARARAAVFSWRGG